MKKKSKNKFYYVLIPIAVIIVIVLIISIYSSILLNSKITESNKDVIVKIDYGSSLSEIITTLNKEDLVKPHWFFLKVTQIYAYFTQKPVLAGYHKFSPNISNGELIYSLFSGNNLYMKRVTFPEGITIKRFASILHNNLNIDSAEFYQKCYNKDIIKKYNINANSLEGYLMPATFNFFLDISVEKIIDILVKEQLKILNKYNDDIKKIKLTQLEVLTLASIIEAETPLINERPRISGVYHNRLKKKMLLQADPTVQYIVGYKQRLLFSDLRIDSPYNTYKYPGLPPGPINSPSKSSIEAAIHPEKNDFLFFVATGDGTNSHKFASNYQGHRKNVSDFRKRLKK